MRDFFESYGVSNATNIRDKYHTPVAELYRMRLVAMRDDLPLPTELPKATSTPSHVSSNESAVDRDKRLREEAEERLRAKFGSGGLKGSAMGSPNDQSGTEEMKRKANEGLQQIGGYLSSLGLSAKEKISSVSSDPNTAATLESVKVGFISGTVFY